MPRVSLAAFLASHNLKMTIRERTEFDKPKDRYSAFSPVIGVLDGSLILTASASGKTPDAAIRNYAREISGRQVIIEGANIPPRRIKVPKLL